MKALVKTIVAGVLSVVFSLRFAWNVFWGIDKQDPDLHQVEMGEYNAMLRARDLEQEEQEEIERRNRNLDERIKIAEENAIKFEDFVMRHFGSENF